MSGEALEVMVARIDENVKTLIKSDATTNAKIDAHILHDEQVNKDYLKPLWEESQQRKGASKASKGIYAVVYGIIAVAAGYFGGHR